MADTNTKHTCNPRKPSQPLPFGKKAPKGECPRCDELHAGAAPRDLPWTSKQNEDEQRCRDITVHFASAKHRGGGCGPVCTYGDW